MTFFHLKGHPELPAGRRAAAAGPGPVRPPGGAVLRHRAAAGPPGGDAASDRGEGPAGLPRPAALLQRSDASTASR